jgi:hypothetical protein
MSDDRQQARKPVKQFRILSIEKAEPPGSVTGGEWYRYTIEHDASPIDGMRSGTLKSVKQHLEEYVENLNARATYGYSAYAARKVKK